jgi:hypothetical protein
MIAPASPSEAHRLAELAEVTKEYATYSRSAYGAAFVVTAVAFLGAVAAELLGYLAFAGFAYLLLPAAWLLLLAGARAYYQRHGIVVEPAQRVAGRGWILTLVYLACASMAVSLAAVMVRWAVGHGTGVGESWALGTTLVIPALVAVPLLTAEVVRGKLDAAVTGATTMVALTGSRWAALPTASGSVADALAQGSSALRVLLLVLGALLAVGMLVLGARDHVRYRRLERRLAALKARK